MLQNNTDGIAVAVRSLTYTVPDIKSKKKLTIVKNVDFMVKPGQLLAIMGPSGSGKSTLLNLLAGRITASKQSIKGKITYNGRRDVNPRMFSRYVMQHDHLLEYMTVDETLMTAAALKMKRAGVAVRQARVNEVLRELGLWDCRNTYIGGHETKGISGGERKRVSIAIELLDNPKLLFLDEPTTGLDSSRAYDTLKILMRLARAGRTIICTVHSPRSPVFALFDLVLLLSKGAVVFHGAANEAVPYFKSIGYACPPHFSPPDFILDMLTEKTDVLATGDVDSPVIRTPDLEASEGDDNSDGKSDVEDELNDDVDPTAVDTQSASEGAFGPSDIRIDTHEKPMVTRPVVPFDSHAPRKTSRDFRVSSIPTTASGTNAPTSPLQACSASPQTSAPAPAGYMGLYRQDEVDESASALQTGAPQLTPVLPALTPVLAHMSLSPRYPGPNGATGEWSTNAATTAGEHVVADPLDMKVERFIRMATGSTALPMNYSQVSMRSPAEQSALSLRAPGVPDTDMSSTSMNKQGMTPYNHYSTVRPRMADAIHAQSYMQQDDSVIEMSQKDPSIVNGGYPTDNSPKVDTTDAQTGRHSNAGGRMFMRVETRFHLDRAQIDALPADWNRSGEAAFVRSSIDTLINTTEKEHQSKRHRRLSLRSKTDRHSEPSATPRKDGDFASKRLDEEEAAEESVVADNAFMMASAQEKPPSSTSEYIVWRAKCWMIEFAFLTYRIFMMHVRFPKRTIFGIVQKIFSGCVLGWFFWQIGATDSTSARNRVGLLFWLCLNSTIALHAVLATFPNRKALVNKETANGMYGYSSYYVAQNIADLPIDHLGHSVFFLSSSSWLA